MRSNETDEATRQNAILRRSSVQMQSTPFRLRWNCENPDGEMERPSSPPSSPSAAAPAASLVGDLRGEVGLVGAVAPADEGADDFFFFFAGVAPEAAPSLLLSSSSAAAGSSGFLAPPFLVVGVSPSGGERYSHVQ